MTTENARDAAMLVANGVDVHGSRRINMSPLASNNAKQRPVSKKIFTCFDDTCRTVMNECAAVFGLFVPSNSLLTTSLH
jgi:hypothetical protein